VIDVVLGGNERLLESAKVSGSSRYHDDIRGAQVREDCALNWCVPWAEKDDERCHCFGIERLVVTENVG
jgi:hypothetical protein